MIVRSLNLQGFGCFADRVEVGPLGPGLNIAFGPNGVGKSTLSRAITTAFLDGHRVKAAEMKALRSWGRRLTPQIGVDFEHDKRVYRIQKQFLENAGSNLLRQEGGGWRSFMTGDDADTFIREMLKCAPPAAGMAQRDKHWGLAQILWSTQGALELPALAPSVVESVQRSVGAQLSADGTVLEQRILEKYAEFYTPARGQLRRSAEAVILAEGRERLEKERSSIEESLAQFEEECSRVEELRVGLAEADGKARNLDQELRNTRVAAQVYARLSAERSERMQKVQAAESAYASVSEATSAVERFRERLRLDELTATEVETCLAATLTTERAAEQIVADLEAAYRHAQNHELAATERLRTSHLAREYVLAIQGRKELDDRIIAIGTKTAQVMEFERQRLEIVAPSEEDLRQFRTTTEAHRDAARRLELARVNVIIDPATNATVEILEGETAGVIDLSSGVQVDCAGAPNLVMAIPGFGTLRIRGPVSDYASVRRDRDRLADELSTFGERFGSSDDKGLEGLCSYARRIEAQAREARSACVALSGDSTVEALQQECLRITLKIAQILHYQPDWIAATPDAVVLQTAADIDCRNARSARADTCTSLMKAQKHMKDAQGTRHVLTQKQQVLCDSIAMCRKELEHIGRDVTDAQRQAALYSAAMDRMANQQALQQIERDLAAHSSDPSGSISLFEAALEAAILEVQMSRDALRDCEGRVVQLSDRAPYSRFAQVCERLETVETDYRREEMRMEAVALLRTTLLDRKSSLLEAVARPVEERATSYLARICGKPLASIRMTHDFAAETVVPADLEESRETVKIERMSGGEREQIHLCTRLALAEELMRDEPHFLLLDDVLTATDNDRLSRVCEMLAELSRRMQIILFTCHPERFADIPEATLIDVEALHLNPALAGLSS